MLNMAEFAWGRYNGATMALAGTFINLRTMAYYQQATDGFLPADGTWHLLSTNATMASAAIASAVNLVLGTNFTSASFHLRTSGDAISSPGQMVNDA